MATKDYNERLDCLEKQILELKKEKSSNNEGLTPKQKADKKYKSKLQSINLRFRPIDYKLWGYLKKQPNMSCYIKNLIAKDMGYASLNECEKISIKNLSEDEQIRYMTGFNLERLLEEHRC